ncbi:glutathione synthase, partial [Pseudomonas sp. GW460-R15]
LLASEASLCVPPTTQVERAVLESVGLGATQLADHVAGLAFPIIARPLGTHAGGGLDRLNSPDAALAYLASSESAEFFV